MNQKEKLAHYKKKAKEYYDAFVEQRNEMKKVRENLKDMACGFAPKSAIDQSNCGHTQMKLAAATHLLNSRIVEFPKGSLHV